MLISAGRRIHDLVVKTREGGDDRWKPSANCLAACWLLYTTVLTESSFIQGYLPLLTRPAHVVHFFRDVHGIYPIAKEVLAKRTNEYR